FGPRAIRAASAIMAWERPYGMAYDPFDRLAVVDYGDCVFDFGRPETVPETIENHAYQVVSTGTALLTLGGDHFVSLPLLRAHARQHGRPLSLLHFDAHSDTWPDESGRIDHGTMFRHAANEGIIEPARSVQIGLRTANDDTMGFNVLDADFVQANVVGGVAAKARLLLGDRPVYLSL